MYDERSQNFIRIIIIADIAITFFSLLISCLVSRYFFREDNIDIISHLYLFPLILTFTISFLSYFGSYRILRYANLFPYYFSAFKSILFSVFIVFIFLYLLKIDYISRKILLIFFFIECFCILFSRLFFRFYFLRSVGKGYNKLRILIIGTGERAKEFSLEINRRDDWGVEIVGYLDPDIDRVGLSIHGVPVIGNIKDIHNCLKKYVVDEVIMAIPRSLLVDAEPIAHACEQEGIKLRFMADIYSLQVARVSLAHIGNIPLLTMEPVSQDADMLFVKRLFDLVATIVITPLLIPVFAAIAIAIKLDSPGPVFFVQERVGLRKHLFPMYKFRSMHVDAEHKLAEIEHLNEAVGPNFKIANDPRVTRVGRFIRKTSLDELPQLLNVVQGQMSLVGPRPMSIRDVSLFDKGIQRKRFSVKPGITCIWQISGRSNLSFNKWLELDLYYIEHWSFWLDIKILFKTIPAVLKSKGAV